MEAMFTSNADLLYAGPVGTYFSEIEIDIRFSFKEMMHFV